MAMCEQCWADAYSRMRNNGRSQYENYLDLLKERKDNPCPPQDPTGKPTDSPLDPRD